MTTPRIAQKKSYPIEVEAGKSYSWCACGESKNQPLCDGSHKGSEFSPVVYLASESKTAYLCGCKMTKNAPLCDGTHKSL